jgi:hypothetical protein
MGLFSNLFGKKKKSKKVKIDFEDSSSSSRSRRRRKKHKKKKSSALLLEKLQEYKAERYNQVMGQYHQEQQWQAYQDQLKEWSDAKNKDHAQVAEQLKATTELMNKMRSEMDSKTAELAKKAIEDAATKQRNAAAAEAAQEAAVAEAEANASRKNREAVREATATATTAAAVAATATAAAAAAAAMASHAMPAATSTGKATTRKTVLPRLTGTVTGKAAVDHKQHNFDLATKKLTSLEEIKRKSEALKLQVETILTKLQESLTHMKGGGSTKDEVRSILTTVKAFETRVKADNATIARKKNEAEAARNETISARTDSESDRALEKVDECLKASQELLPLVEKATANATKESAKVDISLPDATALATKAAANVLYERYYREYAPPMWSLEEVGEGDWMQRAAEVEVYCNESKAGQVHDVVRTREPVNMQMRRPYRNHIDSGYTTFYKENHTLAPNFALYMKAKISQSDSYLNSPLLVHVINTIGYAFDSSSQPDYQYFLTDFNHEKQKEFQDCLTETMSFIFACAKRHDLKKICLCYFGGNYFAFGLEQKGHHYFTYFEEALRRVLRVYKGFTHVYFMGDNTDELVNKLKSVFDEHHIALSSAGRMPHVVKTLGLDTLYVNSWDPHSIVGNGNNEDKQSLDGVFGIHSDMGYMSYTDINPNILTNIVKIPRIKGPEVHGVEGEEWRRAREIQAETVAKNAANDRVARETVAREAAENVARAAKKAETEKNAREAKPVSPRRLRSRTVPRAAGPEATRTIPSPRTARAKRLEERNKIRNVVPEDRLPSPARTKKKRMTADERTIEEGKVFATRTK